MLRPCLLDVYLCSRGLPRGLCFYVWFVAAYWVAFTLAHVRGYPFQTCCQSLRLVVNVQIPCCCLMARLDMFVSGGVSVLGVDSQGRAVCASKKIRMQQIVK